MVKLPQIPVASDAARERIAEFLPKALHSAIDSYHKFTNVDVPNDTKGFSAHHMAAKVAIAHIELLIKLAAWAHIEPENSDDELTTWMNLAKSELKSIQNEESDNLDDDN